MEALPADVRKRLPEPDVMFLLAMHMANELLNPPVAIGLMVLAAVFLAYASWRTNRTFDPGRVPLMGVMGAFVFAAQMINFPILPGTSGHLGGGVLLAILLGPHAATLVMASILIIQCLIFQDGGILALGANIINLGVVPCYLGYALFRLMAGAQPGAGRLYASVFVATLIGMVAGAALVPFQAALSGILAVPLSVFLVAMVGLHLLVGLGEAIITFLVIGYLGTVRPDTLGAGAERLAAARGVIGRRAVVASLLVVALLLGGVVSWYASSAPDALEALTGADEEAPTYVRSNEDPTMARVDALQERTSPLPDYHAPGLGERLGTSVSGVGGVLVTLLVVWLIAVALKRRSPSGPETPSTEQIS